MAIQSLGATLRQINRLFAEGIVAGLSDAQLLQRFLRLKDAEAFEALVGRHGPMVLSVCRGILRDPHDVEDAFQATFLVLVKKGGTIRGRDALAGWLYQVAHRVAIQANTAVARRRALERQVRQMAVANSTNEGTASGELLAALHEEIALLPERYRLAVVHCDLEGMTQAQAAGQLHWSERTIHTRLAEGRARLKRRLARRGLTLGAATLGAVFVRESRAAVPLAWSEATVRAALATMNHTMTAGIVSAAAQELAQEVFKVMLLQKLTVVSATLLAAGLIAYGASAALVLREQEPAKTTVAGPASTVQGKTDTTAPQPQPAPAETAGTFPVHGRVLDPDGRPVAGAGVYVRHHAEIQWNPIDPMAARQKGRVATTDEDGRFHFELAKGGGDLPPAGDDTWQQAQIAAAAPGFALAWVEAGDLLKGGDATLRLIRDDLPVRGRILDSQGRPQAGVIVRIQGVWEVKSGLDLDEVLTSGEVDENQMARWYGLQQRAATWQPDTAPLWPGGQNTWTTGADGRFEVHGIGRDRIARLELHGGGVADGTLDVMARPAKGRPKARPSPGFLKYVPSMGRDAAFKGHSPHGTQLLGATFEYIAGAAKPIAGVVRLKPSGKPVAGAVVSAVDPATHTRVSARTDAEGRFRIDGVPKADYYQVALNPVPGIDPFLRYSEIIDDTEGQKPIDLTIELSPGVIVVGRLVDKSTSRTEPPGYVTYLKAPDNVNAGDAALGFSRRADGGFGMTVPPGHAMLAAMASGKGDLYTGAHLRDEDRKKGIGDFSDDEPMKFPLKGYHAYRYIDVSDDPKSREVELELTRGQGRKGSLIGPTGQPVKGARAYGLRGARGYMQTLESDSFEVYGIERGQPRLVIFAHQDLGLVGSVVLKDDDANSQAPLVVRMERAGSIKGRLVDEDDQPLAGAKLDVTTFDAAGVNLSGGPDGLWPDNQSFTAGADGRFQVDGLKRDVKASIFVSTSARPNARLSAGETLRNLTAAPGEVRDLGNIKVTVVPE
jgi:RNA polymerase sigma factor (sigma-70 family)